MSWVSRTLEEVRLISVTMQQWAMLTLPESASQSQTPICARSIVTAVSVLVDCHHADAAVLKSLSRLECIQASEQ
jgi:hypothetical protein